MSITSELRLFAADPYTGWVPTDKQQADLRAIADRIDAEHQKAVDEWKAKDGQTWLHGYGECHAELMEGNEVIAADLERAGWIKLPLDADGVPIHVGDVMEWPDSSTAEVVGIGSDTFFYVEDGEDAADWSCASDKIHRHIPTVEDVLREFVKRLDEIGSEDDCMGVEEQECRASIRRDIAAAYAEYAARLRLAGDGE